MLHKSILPIILLLTLCSCVVSFGADVPYEETPYYKYTTEQPLNLSALKEDGPVYIAPRDRYLGVPFIINKISMFFLTKVMSVNKDGFTNEVEYDKKWVYGLSLLGLNETDYDYETNHNELLIVYSISTILAHSLYRGIFSVKHLKKIKEGGNCELYLGVGDVPYVGWLFNLSFVCKPTKYLPTFLQDKVTIHIIDIKPFNFILGCVFSTLLIWYTKCNELYIRPQWILGFCTVEINIAKYYNISLNVGSWIVDLITFMKYTKEANEKELKKANENEIKAANEKEIKEANEKVSENNIEFKDNNLIDTNKQLVNNKL